MSRSEHACWAIQHQPTGFFLPWPANGKKFRDVQPWYGVAPRLFADLAQAKNTLASWLEFDGYNTFTRHPQYVWRGDYVPDRPRSDVADDYAVVEVSLSVRPLVDVVMA
jgi:hypothetical protein